MSFRLGLGCGCCGGETPCRARVRAIMSDSQSMLDSGVTVTVEVKDGGTTLATFGPTSPDLSAFTDFIDLDAATTYTAILTVEQVGGPTCSFSRTITTPDPCPGQVNIDLFIPRVWVAFSFCHIYCGGEYLWEMPVSVTGPGGFAVTGKTVTYPDPPPMWPDRPPELRFGFTPCAEGDYVATATPTMPYTTDPSVTINVGYGIQPWPAFSYFNKTHGVPVPPGDPRIKPDPGYVWPIFCGEPIANTLYLTSSLFGSATLVAPLDGECTNVFEGTGTFDPGECDGGGSGSATIFWRLTAKLDVSVSPWSPLWKYSWLLEGYVNGVCRCLVSGPYGSLFRNRSGAGTAYIAGEQIVGEDRTENIFCDDCSALDISIIATMRPSDSFCDPADSVWQGIPYEYRKDTITITA